ncbi:hypothetical protein IMAU10149_01855 [Lactobacillus helveticus]|uniref:BppU family phage baseplate upper protein n=1 Tax=Lactobacillus helveticus TaxID=1587 RepID=UPI001567326B|nr:BppU family phage baseplate upper protein [Lactobacillus helveticus]NRO85263.1 hypothetical protein [Lactobacillus helveticus]
MSLAPITLTTDKSTAVIENTHRKLRQDESGLSITVTVLNEDNTPYNLTGKNLVFCENKQNNKIIIDNGKGNNAGKFNRNSDNDTKGVFTYFLQEDVYAVSGKAWFEITDGTTVDSTKNFYFDVEKDASISISNNDYIGSLKALETAMAGTQSKITSDLADMEAQITKQIADTKAANEGEITQAIKNLTGQTTVALSNVDEYTKKIATLQSQWDNELQSIKNKANTDTDSAVKAINDRYTNDFAKLKSDLANWQTSTTQNYQKQVDSILAKVQENGTEVADVQRQINDAVAKMQDLTKQFSKIDFTLYVHKDDLEGIISQGYVELPLEGNARQHLHGHDGKALSFKKPLIDHDAYAVGRRINDLDTGLTQLNQEIYKTFDTKENAQDLKNEILANSGDIANLSGRIDANQSKIAQTQKALDGKANSSDIISLSGLINANQLHITQAQKDITALQKAKPDLSGYETTTAAQTLADRITALENKKPIKANSQDDAVAKSKSSNDEYYW